MNTSRAAFAARAFSADRQVEIRDRQVEKYLRAYRSANALATTARLVICFALYLAAIGFAGVLLARFDLAWALLVASAVGVFGRLILAHAHGTKASLDAAIGGSPFLSEGQKADFLAN